MQLHTTLKSYYCKKELSWTFNQQKTKKFLPHPRCPPWASSSAHKYNLSTLEVEALTTVSLKLHNPHTNSKIFWNLASEKT